MPKIDLKEIMKSLNLTEDQAKLIDDTQNKLDTTINSVIETEKKGVLTKNEELLEKLKAAKENQIPDGFDNEGYEEYVKNKDQIEADKKRLEEEKLIATENWDKLKNDMNNNHEQTLKKETGKLSKEIKALRSTLDSELIENSALKEIEKAKGNQVLLMPHVKGNMKTIKDETTGRFAVKVIDSTGQERMNTETGNPMTVGELISEFQANEQFAGAFPLQNRGSNTTIVADGNTNYNSTNNPFDKSGKNYSLTEQAKLNKTNPILAKTLRESVITTS